MPQHSVWWYVVVLPAVKIILSENDEILESAKNRSRKPQSTPGPAPRSHAKRAFAPTPPFEVVSTALSATNYSRDGARAGGVA